MEMETKTNTGADRDVDDNAGQEIEVMLLRH